MTDDREGSSPRRRGAFETTRWSVIRAAARAGTPESRRAFTTLCEKYQGPVYEFIRCRWGEDKARDLTQGFFARLLEKEEIADADPALGKFRSWLLKAARNYCINEWRRAHAEKRGGAAPHVAIEDADAEGQAPVMPGHDVTPERMYERRWALTLLAQALQALRDEHVESGQELLFEKLKLCLIGWNEQKHAEIAQELGIARVNTFDAKVNRFKARFQALLRREIAMTVSNEDEMAEELRHLYCVLQAS
jgi:RNA polymerase sigma-70 factor (ECF subfamily)